MLLDEGLPPQEVGVGLEGGLALVRGLEREDARLKGRRMNPKRRAAGRKATHRLKGHREPSDLPAVRSQRPVGELAREQVGLGQGVAFRMQQRQDGG